ncbi:MAG: hypothetical protein HQ557_20115, partial [Bacteroidetes bacterium]|nr:hypothetical protein [Bacteroidota bacterium]
LLAADDILKQADDLFDAEKYIEGFELMENALLSAGTNREKAEIYWRMAKFQLNITDDEEDAGTAKETLLEMFTQGSDYATMATELYPSADSYYWRSSNVGRWGETKGILDSLFKAGPMKEDLLKVIEYDAVYADAWYVFSRLYLKLPGWPISFGNAPFAISFARRAIDTYAEEDLKISYYKSLAETLWKRNWNVSTRKREIKNRESKLKNAKNEHDKQAYFESSLGINYSPNYTSNKLVDMTDREEAKIITDWLLAEYAKISDPSKGDKNNIQEVKDMVAEWK